MIRSTPASDRDLLIELARRLRAAGCFERCDREYVQRLRWLVPLVGVGYVALWCVRPGPAWVALCVAVGVASVQQGIVSHDAGHGMIHRHRARNAFWGHFGMSFLCGLSFSHWCIMHDAHHANPQDEGRDPDVQFKLLFSFHERAAASRQGLGRVLLVCQPLTFWPLAALYSWSLRWDSIARLFSDPRRTRIDRWVLPGHYALWLLVPSMVVGPAVAVATYVTVSTVIGLYLVAIFSPNHVGMPSLRSDEPRSYLRQQTGTARDIEGGRLVGLLMGGLEHQIAHHLFPRIGQPRLGEARRIVAAFCAEHGVPRHAVGFWRAHLEILAHLACMATIRRSQW